MPAKRDDPERSSLAAFQRMLRRAGPAAGAGYTLVGAVLFLGALGYLGDHWWGTFPIFLVIGLLLGVVVGFYELAKTVWKR